MKYFFLLNMSFSLLMPMAVWADEDPDELYRQGRFEEAEAAYARLDMDRPKDLRYRYNRGCAAYQKGDFQGAKAAFSSVARRSEDEDIQFKTAYNLGNTAFKEGDFQSAIEQYKEAILTNPESEDAKYNLELALRELEKLKNKKNEEQKKEDQKDSDQSGDKKDSSKSEGKDKEEKDTQSGSKDKKNDSGQEDLEKQDEQEQDQKNNSAQNKEQSTPPEDLSGNLAPLQAMPEQAEDQIPEQLGETLDQKKAEALLDNLKEDRSRYLRFMIPEDKKHGVTSGKDW